QAAVRLAAAIGRAVVFSEIAEGVHEQALEVAEPLDFGESFELAGIEERLVERALAGGRGREHRDRGAGGGALQNVRQGEIDLRLQIPPLPSFEIGVRDAVLVCVPFQRTRTRARAEGGARRVGAVLSGTLWKIVSIAVNEAAVLRRRG